MVRFLFYDSIFPNLDDCSYNLTLSGPSGNITVNGTLTCQLDSLTTSVNLKRRGLGAGKQNDVDLNEPPYAIHNGKSVLGFVIDKILLTLFLRERATFNPRIGHERYARRWTGGIRCTQSLGFDGGKGDPSCTSRDPA